MNRPTVQGWAAVVAVMTMTMTLAGCSGIAPSMTGESAGGSDDFPVGRWEACALPGQPDRRCGSIDVGAASDDDDSRIRIAVAVTPARDPDGQSRGPLIVDSGGPLQSGIAFQAAFAAMTLDSVRDNFDIVGYDRRGYGKSSPLTCVIADPPYFEESDLLSQWEAFAPDAEVELDRCVDETDGRVLNAGTLAGVRDLEAVRSALDVDVINMLAVSYGTVLGQAYLAEHPDHVRAMIFDGTLDPAKTGPQYTLDGSLDETDAADSYGTDREFVTAEGFVDAYTQITAEYEVPAYAQDLAYSCTDFVWPADPSDLTDVYTVQQQAQILSSRANCFGWPASEPLDTLVFSDTAPKPMLVNSLDDRRTTLAEATAVAERTGGTLITMPGTFHGVVNNFTCPAQIAAAYLLSAELPPASECPKPQPIAR